MGGVRFREASMNIQGCKREHFEQDGVEKMCKVGVWKEMNRGGMGRGWKQGGGRRWEKRGEIQASSLGAVRVRSKESDTEVKQDRNFERERFGEG